MINLPELRDELREHLGTDEDDLDNDKADLLLNRAYWEIIDKFAFREKEVSATFVTAAGTRSYNVPSPFEALRQLSIADVDTGQHAYLERMTLETYESIYIDTEDARGVPTHYVREGCAVKLWPTPADIYTLTIKYWTVLADLVDVTNETPDIPQQWHELILMGAVYRGYKRIGDYPRANQALAHWERKVGQVKPVEAKEEADSHFSGLEVLGRDYNGQMRHDFNNTRRPDTYPGI